MHLFRHGLLFCLAVGASAVDVTKPPVIQANLYEVEITDPRQAKIFADVLITTNSAMIATLLDGTANGWLTVRCRFHATLTATGGYAAEHMVVPHVLTNDAEPRLMPLNPIGQRVVLENVKRNDKGPVVFGPMTLVAAWQPAGSAMVDGLLIAPNTDGITSTTAGGNSGAILPNGPSFYPMLLDAPSGHFSFWVLSDASP